jgi:fucose permease
MINLSQVFFCLGAVLAPQIVAVLLVWQIEWPWIFGIFCLLITFFAVLFILLFRGVPQQKGTQSEDYVQVPTQTHRKEAIHQPLNIGEEIYGEKAEKEQLEKKKANNVYTDSLFIRVAAFMLFYVAVEGVIVTWIAAYFDTSLGMSPSASAWRLAIFWAGLLAGRLLIVFLPVRYGLWQPVLIGSFGMMLGVFLLSFIQIPFPATIILLFLGFFAGPIWPSTVGISRQISNTNRFTTGIIAGGALGLVIVPVSSSLLIRNFGFKTMFLIVAGIALLQLLSLMTFLPKTISKISLDSKRA